MSHLSHTCKTSLLFAQWLSVFTLAVPLFRFTLQSNGWQAKTTHSENTSPKQPPQTTLLTLQAPGGTKTLHLFYSDLREHICCLNTQSGSRSPLKRLSESREEAAVLEPVLRACFLPLAAPGAQGSQTAPKPFEEPGSCFWYTSPKQRPQTTLPTLQAPGFTKMIHSFCSDLREHVCCPNTQSGSRSPLKRLPELREEAAVLEPVLRACLLPLAAPGAQGSQTAPKPFWGARKPFMEPFCSTI